MKKNIKLYFITFFAAYMFLSAPKLFSEEIIKPDIFTQYFQDFNERHIFESEEGLNFLPIEESPLDLEAFIRFAGQSIPSRNELVQKLSYYYTEYCDAKRKAETAIKNLNIWNNAWEDLFEAASVSITTYGSNNYIKCFSVAIITYATKNFIRFWKEGEEMYIQTVRMDCNAENFDFYMKVLKYYYGS